MFNSLSFTPLYAYYNYFELDFVQNNKRGQRLCSQQGLSTMTLAQTPLHGLTIKQKKISSSCFAGNKIKEVTMYFLQK